MKTRRRETPADTLRALGVELTEDETRAVLIAIGLYGPGRYAPKRGQLPYWRAEYLLGVLDRALDSGYGDETFRSCVSAARAKLADAVEA